MANSFKIGFFGAGKMAEGILSAVEDKTSVIMAEKVAGRAAELKNKYPVTVTDDLKEVAEKAKLIFLSVKPQDVAAVAAEVKPILKPTQVLVSIVAGKKLSGLRRAFGAKVRMLRVMPNLALQSHWLHALFLYCEEESGCRRGREDSRRRGSDGSFEREGF